MKTTRLCWLLLAASTICLAQTAPVAANVPQARIGDSRDYEGQFLGTNCRHWETRRQEAGNVTVRQCEDKLLYMDSRDLSVQRVTTLKGETLLEFKPRYQGLSFPLFVGKKWRSQYAGFRADQNRKWDSRLECEVKVYEPVRVPAGNFDAFRVECVDNWEFGYIFSGKKAATRWYAPAAGGVVKYTSEDGEWNYELAAFRQATAIATSSAAP